MVEIYFSEVSKEVQEELLELFEIDNPEDMNWNSFPIAVINKPEK